MGGRLLATPEALKPVMAEMRKRGLVYLEDASTALTVSETVAEETKLSERRAQVVIDADPSPQSIAAALELLEGEANANGFAIGTGSGLEVTVDACKAMGRAVAGPGHSAGARQRHVQGPFGLMSDSKSDYGLQAVRRRYAAQSPGPRLGWTALSKTE